MNNFEKEVMWAESTTGEDFQCVHVDFARELQAEINRLRNLLLMPLTSEELRLVDKHCDWEAFKHAWNAVLKSRLGEIDNQQLKEEK